jgi:hypothetical protein
MITRLIETTLVHAFGERLPETDAIASSLPLTNQRHDKIRQPIPTLACRRLSEAIEKTK